MKTNQIEKTELETKLNIKIVRSLEDIRNLSSDWDDLFKRADNANPYYSRAWIQTFISEAKNNGAPILITAWSDSKLVALLPLTIKNYFGIKAAIGTPSSVLCCTGMLVDSQYQSAIRLIAETCARDKIAHIFYNKLTSSWDESTNNFFDELFHHGFVNRRWKRHVCLKAQLESDFDQLLRKTRNKKQRQKLLYHEKQIFKSDDVVLKRYDGMQITTEIVKRIGDIQNNSWVKIEEEAYLVKPLYQKLLFELGQSDIGSAWVLSNKEEDIAFLYSLRVRDNLYIKWMSYKQKYGSSTLSFGKALYTQVIREACKEGVNIVDFGFGEDKWKHHWASDKENIYMIISGQGVIGRIAVIFFSMLKKCARYKWLLTNRLKQA